MFYDGYGKPVWTPSSTWYDTSPFNQTTAQPFQYKGQYGYYTDGTSGLAYCVHRYYDPLTGRWTERDPSGLDGGVNVYAYSDGDPVIGGDPSGLRDDDDPGTNILGLEFKTSIVLDGLATGSTNLMRSLTFGHWRHPEFENHIGAEFSAGAGVVAREAIITVLTAGAANLARMYRLGRMLTPMKYGIAAEENFRKAVGGVKGYFYVAGLGRRYVDCLIGTAAYEFKTGAVELTKEIGEQIAKDALLLARKEVSSVTWVFARNLSSGAKSIAPEVRAALRAAGIKIQIRYVP